MLPVIEKREGKILSSPWDSIDTVIWSQKNGLSEMHTTCQEAGAVKVTPSAQTQGPPSKFSASHQSHA